jgi:hypothetical protein
MNEANYVHKVILQFKKWGITKEQINQIYDEANVKDDELNPVKNIDRLLTYMIREKYVWDEIMTLIAMLKRNKGNELIEILQQTQI